LGAQDRYARCNDFKCMVSKERIENHDSDDSRAARAWFGLDLIDGGAMGLVGRRKTTMSS